MAKQRPHANQLAFDFGNASIEMTPTTAEHAAIVHAHLPPPILPPIIPSTVVTLPMIWDFKNSFPTPLPEAVNAGIFGDEEPTTEQIRSLHLEHANELLGILDSLETLLHAKETGTNPQTGKRPRTAAGRKRLDEQLQSEPADLQHQFENLLAVYADGFGGDAAKAFESCVRAAHQSPSLRTNCSDEPQHDVPVPSPLQSAVAKGVFGIDENEDPVEPSPDEVHEISRQHGERLAELFISLDDVNESLANKSVSGREKHIQEKERLTCQIQGMLGLYAEDFGEVAARHLESWARQEAFRQVHIDDGHEDTREVCQVLSTAPQYDAGHPWHYLGRGDGQKPVPVEEISAVESDGTFVGKLPKDYRKRREKLSQILAEQSRQLVDDKTKYQDIIERGALALSEYDRAIAYGGDIELAVASSIALKFNHIRNGLGRIRWLRLQLGRPLQDADATASSTADAASAAPQHPVASPVVGSAPLQGTNNGGLMQTDTEPSKQQTPTRIEKLEKLHETVEQALDQLATALEAGRSETLKAWLTTMSRFHDYSLGNQMLIAWQKPDATHVAGFHAWKKFNRLVNKGEKGIMILAPVTRVVATMQEQDPSGSLKEMPVRKLVNTKIVYVFDLTQTHGEPLPELSTVHGDPATFTNKLKDLIAEKGIELYFAERLSMEAQGRSEGGRIGVQHGLSPAEEFRTLSHELAHELLHRGDRRKETTKRSRELEAESVAFVVCTAIGLDARETSTDYIHLYRGDKAALLESLRFIRTVASDILSGLLPSRSEPTQSVAQF